MTTSANSVTYFNLYLDYLPNVEGFKITKFYFGCKFLISKYYVGCHYTYKDGSGTCLLAFIPTNLIPNWLSYHKYKSHFKVTQLDIYNKVIHIQSC